MSGVLVIGTEELTAIKEALTLARAKPIPWDDLKTVLDGSPTSDVTMLRDRSPNVEPLRMTYPSQNVILGTYRAAISFEHQPAGLFRHLSVSSARKDKVPNEHCMQMVTQAFGFSSWPPSRPYRVWIEEFEPGHMAINILEIEA